MYPIEYEVRETPVYTNWFDRLRDLQAKDRITERVRRLSRGNFGDVKSIGEGIFELRLDYGPGYRIYFIRRDTAIVILLSGGDKKSQRRDVETARALAREL